MATRLSQRVRIPRGEFLRNATIRDFSGGWNVIDNDLNLDTRFAKTLKNMQRSVDGALEVRPGTRLFADTSEFIEEIVNMDYFNGQIIAVGSNGKVVRINSIGEVRIIWDDDFAKNLPGSPSGWDTTEFCSFAVFNGDLTIHNGVNKPLIIDGGTNLCTFLNDPATGSNANTPIGRYAVTHGRYLCIGGDPEDGDALHISSTDTSGVFLGDPDPNDSVTLSLGSRVPIGDQTIKGIGRFRDRLVVAFEEALLPGTLGTFTGSDHTPTFDDAIENHGTISHRVIQSLGDDMLFCDPNGVSSVRRALFTGNVRPERFSQLVDPEIQKDVNAITSTKILEDYAFSLYDSQDYNYMLFIPQWTTITNKVETRGFVLKKIESLKITAWQEFRDWNWGAACRSELKRVFFSIIKGSEVYIMGNNNDKIYRDFEKSEEMWDDDTAFGDGHGWSPHSDDNDSGVPIRFDWELPWADHNQRFNLKQSRYINFDTEGMARFKVDMYTDNFIEDPGYIGQKWEDDEGYWDDGFGWYDSVRSPAITKDFVGGKAPGFGKQAYGQDFGSGRPTKHEGLYGWPARYKIQKLRMYGDAHGPLKFISLTLAYLTGSIRVA